MQVFFDILRRRKYTYAITISLAATVLLLNEVIEFGEKVISNPVLLIYSLVILSIFVFISIKEEFWINEKL